MAREQLTQRVRFVPVSAHVNGRPVLLETAKARVGAVCEKEGREAAVVVETDGDVEGRNAALLDKDAIRVGAGLEAEPCLTVARRGRSQWKSIGGLRRLDETGPLFLLEVLVDDGVEKIGVQVHRKISLQRKRANLNEDPATLVQNKRRRLWRNNLKSSH